jgi:hypothetical protein
LFEASVDRDESEYKDTDRLCLYTPALTSEGLLSNPADAQPGEVRELAVRGAVLAGTDWTVSRQGVFDWGACRLSDRGDVLFVDVSSTGMEFVADYVAVLRPGEKKWKKVLRMGEAWENGPLEIRQLSIPSINAGGQLVCIVLAGPSGSYEGTTHVVRVEADGQLTVLARQGDQVGDNVVVTRIMNAAILSDGKVVYRATLKSGDFFRKSESALVLTDGQERRLILRETDLTSLGIEEPAIQQYQANDQGQLGVLVEGVGRGQALLLFTPELAGVGSSPSK